MRRHNLILAGLIVASAVACSGSSSNTDNRAPDINDASPSEVQESQATDASIIQLVANPERYHGKFVRVIGFVHLEFEGNAIYLHREDFENGLDKNSLWLSVADEIRKESAKYNDKYVLVEGTFNSQNRGHMGINSGAIENIRRLQVWASERGR